jgi:hypothetical protein
MPTDLVIEVLELSSVNIWQQLDKIRIACYAMRKLLSYWKFLGIPWYLSIWTQGFLSNLK